MIGSTGRVRAFACASPVDMRKDFDGLFAMVRRELCRHPLSGELFLFVNKTRKRAKVLLCVQRRLPSGEAEITDWPSRGRGRLCCGG